MSVPRLFERAAFTPLHAGPVKSKLHLGHIQAYIHPVHNRRALKQKTGAQKLTFSSV